jgi:hypothetical protein
METPWVYSRLPMASFSMTGFGLQKPMSCKIHGLFLDQKDAKM